MSKTKDSTKFFTGDSFSLQLSQDDTPPVVSKRGESSKSLPQNSGIVSIYYFNQFSVTYFKNLITFLHNQAKLKF